MPKRETRKTVIELLLDCLLKEQNVGILVRRRPRSLDEPYSLRTLQWLVGFMAEESGLRFSTETVRLILKANDIVISRLQKVNRPDPEYEVKKGE